MKKKEVILKEKFAQALISTEKAISGSFKSKKKITKSMIKRLKT